MKLVKNIGLAVFLCCFAIFLCLPFMGTYRLTSQHFESVVIDSAHRAALAPNMQAMFDKSYANNFNFLADYGQALDKTNQQFKDKEAWAKVIHTDYALPLAKISARGFVKEHIQTLFYICFIISSLGGLIYFIADLFLQKKGDTQHKQVFKSGITNRGISAIVFAVFLIAFYILLYQAPAYLSNWVLMVDPLSIKLTGSQASHWFLYGFMYCLVMLVMGLKMLIKHRHSNYQLVRTVSVIFFQVAFAFMIPNILTLLQLPSADLKNIWPLDYTFFFDYHLNDLLSAGLLGYWMLGWGIFLIVVGVPVMVYFFGKRWYCSWVCGCGGLAETFGDPFRHLSDKSIKSWKIERYLVHGVLLFAVVMTVAVLYTFFTGSSTLLGINTYGIRQVYAFAIGFIFAGAVGTGFYPLMGNRVWCRFGCPLAAYLGIVQRFKSRYRITTNGGQCISCGNCSTYCEMGIDVRAYAQRGENIIRASCVGCGICAEVCPRGVLKLENGPENNRFENQLNLIRAKNEV